MSRNSMTASTCQADQHQQKRPTSARPTIDKIGRSSSIDVIMVNTSASDLSSSFSERQRLGSTGTSSYFATFLPIAFTPEEIQLLRDSFSPFIKDSKDIGLAVMQKVIGSMPETLETFRASPNRVIRTGDEWELMNQGVTFLHAIERCLLRLDKSDYLNAYVYRLLHNHRRYNVSMEQMLLSLGIFMQVILDRLAEQHNHRSSTQPSAPSSARNSKIQLPTTPNNSTNNSSSNSESNPSSPTTELPPLPSTSSSSATAIPALNLSPCLTCSTWMKFHGLLSVLFTTFKTTETTTSSTDQNK